MHTPAAAGGAAAAVALNPLTGMFAFPLVMTAGGSATHFEVAPEELNAVAADLDTAIEELVRAGLDAREFRYIQPPGEDEVSVNGTKRISSHLTEGSGSAVQTVNDMMTWVTDFRNKIEAAKRQYEGVEADNETKFV